MTAEERLYQLSEIAEQHHIDTGMSFSLAFQAVLKGEVVRLCQQNQRLREAAEAAVQRYDEFVHQRGVGISRGRQLRDLFGPMHHLRQAALAATEPPAQEEADA